MGKRPWRPFVLSQRCSRSSDKPEAASGEKPKPINIAAVTATGVPKPAAPSKNAPKLKAMKQQLQATIVGDVTDAALENFELALLVGELVEKDHVENDPADRPQAVAGTVDRCHQSHADRHAEDEDGDQEGRDQTE